MGDDSPSPDLVTDAKKKIMDIEFQKKKKKKKKKKIITKRTVLHTWNNGNEILSTKTIDE